MYGYRKLTGVLGVPLVPGIVCAVAVPVDSSLQDGVAGVTIDANPSGTGSIIGARDPGHCDGSGHAGEARAHQDGAGPVVVVLDKLGDVGGDTGADALGLTLPDQTVAASTEGGVGAEHRGEQGGGGELHIEIGASQAGLRSERRGGLACW